MFAWQYHAYAQQLIHLSRLILLVTFLKQIAIQERQLANYSEISCHVNTVLRKPVTCSIQIVNYQLIHLVQLIRRFFPSKMNTS